MQDPAIELRNQVSTHPWTSVATAAALGAGLAVVLHPRSLLGRTMLVVTRAVVLDKLTRWVTAAVVTIPPIANRSSAPPS